MAVNLLGASDARVNFGDVAIGGATAITVAFTIRTPAALTGSFFITQWGNLLAEQALLIDRVDTDEIEILVAQGGGSAVYYGLKTTDAAIATSSLLRIVGRIDLVTPSIDIWINGAVRTGTLTFNDGPTSIANANSPLCVGHQTDFPGDGVDGEYSEFAIWLEKVPVWVAEAYGKGMSPAFYRNANSFLYAPMVNVANLRDIWTSGTGTNTAGTDAAHPPVYYPSAPFLSRTGSGGSSGRKVTQFVKLLVQLRPTVVASASACTGGGTVASSTNPTAGTSLATASTPVAYMTLTTSSGTEYYSSLPLATNRFYEPRVIRWGPIRRSLSDWFGGFDVSTFEVELSDTDRRLRTLAAAGPLLKQRINVFVGDLAVLKAGGVARRVFSGVVTWHKAQPQLRYTFRCEDNLGAILSQFFSGKKQVPTRTFTLEDFPNLGNPPDDPISPGNPSVIGKAVPLCYGSLSDESAGASAIGVVQPTFVGTRNVNNFDWDEYVICQGSIKRIQSHFTPAGPGLSAGPAIEARIRATNDGSDVLFPGQTLYTAYVDGNMYRDFNGRRYTVCYGLGPRSALARTGTVPFTINLCGYESVGDGTGTMIDSLALQIQHFITNFVLTTYTSGNWAAIPTSDGYSYLKSSTFTNCKTVSEARLSGGYLGAWMLAHDLQPVSLHEAIADLCRSADLDLGLNWDGQLIGSMVDSSAAAQAAWTDTLSILQDQFDLDRQFDLASDKVVYNFARRYAEPLTKPTPEETLPLPDQNKLGTQDWFGSDETPDDAGANATLGDKPYEVDFGALRDATIAADVALERQVRSAAGDEGPLFGTLKTRVSEGGQDVDLGDNITATHFGGLGASGFSARKMRIRAQELDLNDMTVTHTLQDLSA